MTTSKSSEGGYAVGYGKPPKHGQFKPGQTGNPKGRAKGRKSFEDLFWQEANRLVTVKSGDKVERITKSEALMRRLFQSSMEGKIQALRLVLPLFGMLAPKLAAELAADEKTPAADLPDEEIVRRMLARISHLNNAESE